MNECIHQFRNHLVKVIVKEPYKHQPSYLFRHFLLNHDFHYYIKILFYSKFIRPLILCIWQHLIILIKKLNVKNLLRHLFIIKPVVEPNITLIIYENVFIYYYIQNLVYKLILINPLC